MGLVTGQDLTDYFNPEGTARKFSHSNLSATALTLLIRNAEKPVYAALPEKYRRMKAQVTGYVLTREAVGDGTETTFSVPTIAQDASAVTVWVNPSGLYGDRKTADAVDSSLAANVITLDDALDQYDVAVCDITHSFANPPEILKTYALDLAAALLVRSLPHIVDDQIRQSILDNGRDTLLVKLRDLSKGLTRIEEWDALDLVDETETVVPEGPGTLYPTGW